MCLFAEGLHHPEHSGKERESTKKQTEQAAFLLCFPSHYYHTAIYSHCNTSAAELKRGRRPEVSLCIVFV